jgi:hypothetical protein
LISFGPIPPSIYATKENFLEPNIGAAAGFR